MSIIRDSWMDRVRRRDGPFLVLAGVFLVRSASSVRLGCFRRARLFGALGALALTLDRRLHALGFGR